MKPATVRVGICLFSFGGNGGIPTMSPILAEWLCRLTAQLKTDPRIEYAGGVGFERGRAYTIYSDTPISMMRNRAVEEAQADGCDFLLMLDNDNEPDGYWNPAGPNSDEVKPFWDSSFDFAYERLMCGLPTVIVAPYCATPPHPVGKPGWIDGGEVPYLFQWSNNESDNPHSHKNLEMMTRNEASRMSGIHPVAAAPTGVSLWALKVFDGMKQPHFYYEFNASQSHRQSTEDTACTRDVSLFWHITAGENVVFANCDAWALHCKTKHVGRPSFTPIETVGENFAETIRQNWSGNDRLKHLVRETPHAGNGVVLGRDQNQVVVSDEFIAQRMREDAEREGAKNPPAEEPSPIMESVAEMQAAVEEAFDDCEIDRALVVGNTEESFDEEGEEDSGRLEAVRESGQAIQPPLRVDGHELREDADSFWIDEDLTPEQEAKFLERVEGAKGNGLFVRDRKIGGRLVKTVGRELPDSAVQSIENLAGWCKDERDGLPFDAAVVHSDTGQAAAAILPMLPEGSHLYCLDNLGSREHGADKAIAFSESFKPELETGRVMADIESRNFPLPHQPAELDVVFIERFVTRDWLEIWQRHLKPNGILAGYAGSRGEEQVVRDYAEESGLLVHFDGGVFAVPMTIESHA